MASIAPTMKRADGSVWGLGGGRQPHPPVRCRPSSVESFSTDVSNTHGRYRKYRKKRRNEKGGGQNTRQNDGFAARAECCLSLV